MPRPRTGTAYEKNNKWYVGVRLRSGRKWATPCPPREDGVPVDQIHARAVAANLQRDYDAGKWNPEAEAAKEAKAAASSADTAPAPVTVLEHARAWIATQRYGSADKDKKRINFYLAAAPLASMPVAEVRPRHVLAFIRWLEERPSARGGKLSARSVRNVYDVVRRALASAVIEDLIAASPCAPLSNALPTLEDKHPGARETWLFTRDEVERLISDASLLPDRRVTYAILFLTGCRWGELAALRWRDWNADAKPLGRLTISRAIEPGTKREKGTKTGAVKRVPVHPTLAEVLAAWQARGWEATFGRAPTADDFVMPSRRLTPRGVDNGNRYLHEDCAKLGLVPRHVHCTRRTFISLAQDDGGEAAKLKWVTHAPPKAVFDQYTTLQWKTLCAEVAKLEIRLRRPAGAVVLPFTKPEGTEGEGEGRLATGLATGTDGSPGFSVISTEAQRNRISTSIRHPSESVAISWGRARGHRPIPADSGAIPWNLPGYFRSPRGPSRRLRASLTSRWQTRLGACSPPSTPGASTSPATSWWPFSSGWHRRPHRPRAGRR